ncbi:response regulator [Marivita lacus]|jgi:two-component system chemotaxis response regulator CheY|uniref:Response regulator n=1 Tax=Marivita lacus TaxID=1323742 RepID=A0ABQ1KX58_9RHOB|nr:response regulator [Marivita lacus]GGC09767.1 response regulator [Marivita lacus]
MSIMVLAIDDSRTIRSMVRQALAAAGFSCELAEDGVEGVRRFEELRPDVVITDINMPHMDGFGVIEAIRKDVANRRIPILVLTTETATEFKTRARDAGATGWIGKPFDDQALVQVIRRVTGAS